MLLSQVVFLEFTSWLIYFLQGLGLPGLALLNSSSCPLTPVSGESRAEENEEKLHPRFHQDMAAGNTLCIHFYPILSQRFEVNSSIIAHTRRRGRKKVQISSCPFVVRMRNTKPQNCTCCTMEHRNSQKANEPSRPQLLSPTCLPQTCRGPLRPSVVMATPIEQ